MSTRDLWRKNRYACHVIVTNTFFNRLLRPHPLDAVHITPIKKPPVRSAVCKDIVLLFVCTGFITLTLALWIVVVLSVRTAATIPCSLRTICGGGARVNALVGRAREPRCIV